MPKSTNNNKSVFAGTKNASFNIPEDYTGSIKITTRYSGMRNFVTSNSAVIIMDGGAKQAAKYVKNRNKLAPDEGHYTIERA